MYGSPDRRTWSRCASRATSYASSISAVSRWSSRLRTDSSSGRSAPSTFATARRGGRVGRRGASHRSPACGRGSRRAGRGRARKPSSSTNAKPTTAPPSRSTSRAVAAAVPPVAITSSTIEHLLAGRDRVAVDLEQVGAVLELVLLALDLPRQLARPCAPGTNPAVQCRTRPAPRTRSPRASMPSTLSIRVAGEGLGQRVDGGARTRRAPRATA